jgi:hypothetical protein
MRGILIVEYKTCGEETLSGVGGVRSAFESRNVTNHTVTCRDGHRHTYSKQDMYFDS